MQFGGEIPLDGSTQKLDGELNAVLAYCLPNTLFSTLLHYFVSSHVTLIHNNQRLLFTIQS